MVYLASASDEQESSDEDYNEADDVKDGQDPAGADAGGDAAKVHTHTHTRYQGFSQA